MVNLINGLAGLDYRFFDGVNFDNNNLLQTGKLAYGLVKSKKLKKALTVGTNTWFIALCMAKAGAWVVMLNKDKCDPEQWGILNCYQDKVFQVNINPAFYLKARKTIWDIIYTEAPIYNYVVKNRWGSCFMYLGGNRLGLQIKL